MSVESLKSVRIAGCGMYVPKNIVTNAQIIERHQKAGMDTFTDEGVRLHTGIVERHINNDPASATSDMAARAGQQALVDAGMEPDQVDLVIVATITGDYPSTPATANIVQAKLGMKHAYAFDFNAACSGFIGTWNTAVGLIESGRNKNGLIIGADMLSTITNPDDRNTCFLFADGAGAVLLSASNEPLTRMVSHLGSDGSNPSLLYTPAGGSREPLTPEKLLAQDHTLHMKGREIFNRAVEAMSDSIDIVLEKAGMTINQVDWLIPHQANLVIINTLLDIQGVDPARAIINIQSNGNTSAASIPIALAEADQIGKIKPNDVILATAFGAGLTWGSMLFKWKENP